MKYNRYLALIIIFCMLLSGICYGDGTVASANSQSESPAGSGTVLSENYPGYSSYISHYKTAAHPDDAIAIPADSYSAADPSTKVLDNYAGFQGKSIETSEDGFAQWQVNVPDQGLYNIELTYYPVAGHGSQIERELQINGVTPFEEAGQLTFQRLFKDALNQSGFQKDSQGNEIRPEQVECPSWMTVFLTDSMCFYTQPLQFYFNKGINTIRLNSIQEPMVIGSIKLLQAQAVPTYKQVLAQSLSEGYKPADSSLTIQAENAAQKSDPVLYPTSDMTSPATEPTDGSKIVLNTIGGSGSWSLPGQFITWTFNVKESGLYKIAFRYRQDMVSGMFVNRSLKIDGQYPFAEAEDLKFNYSSDWQMYTVGGDKNPYLFKLDKGTHTITLSVVLGDLAGILKKAQDSLSSLDDDYRQIIMVTGTSPDVYRDYLLDQSLPKVMKDLYNQSKTLDNLSQALYKITGQRGANSAILQSFAYELNDMYNNPVTIPSRLATFDGNLGSLGTWINSAQSQPLELDYIAVYAPDKKLPKTNANFFATVLHEIDLYISSYFVDYSNIGNIYGKTKKTITVWTTTGRDQAQALKQMIDDTFVQKTGIGVNLQLVQPGVMLPAVSAGRGPDVALNVADTDPVNYATRKAVVDLSKLSGFDEVEKSFYDSALTPYRFDGGTYALPEQQLFLMMFYRKDILSSLNISIPKTWDDLYLAIAQLQKQNLNFAMPVSDITTPGVGFYTFSMLLYQHLGQLYKSNGVASDLDSEVAIQAFKQWCELYQDYNLPIKVDFANRFRTGEVPLLITDYSFYNMISVFAPELKNKWGFAPVPGILQPDDTINNSVPGFGTGCMILSNSKNIDASWQFIKWWTGEDAQTTFGREMKSILGAAGMYPTANKAAAQSMSWSAADFKLLQSQWVSVKGIPQVPGGYYTPRNLDNAFRQVVIYGKDYRDTLLDYVQTMNDEITSKRKEFGLNTSKGSGGQDD